MYSTETSRLENTQSYLNSSFTVRVLSGIPMPKLMPSSFISVSFRRRLLFPYRAPRRYSVFFRIKTFSLNRSVEGLQARPKLPCQASTRFCVSKGDLYSDHLCTR